MKNEFQAISRIVYRSSLAMLLLAAFVIEPAIAAAGAPGEPVEPGPSLTPDQKIVEVISRLTFGARPGDFEHIQKIGIKEYIAQQLDPESIDDSALQKRLDRIPTLNL